MVNAYPQAITHTKRDWENVPVSPYVKDFTDQRKQHLLSLLDNEGDVQVLKFHQSLCPGCVDEEKWDTMKIDCVTYVKNNKVWMKKSCGEHGTTKEVYWADWDMYKKAEKFQDPGIKILNPHIDKNEFDIDCPNDCGLCVEHESHTGLGNIVVTNRCDLTCWYCFFYAKEGEPVYEPSMDQIKFMLKRMRNEKPVGANSIQFTGGEPTLRPDLPEILQAAKDIGYDHVQLNTNGINLAHDPELAPKLRASGVSNLYLSFDGCTPQTNPKNYWEAKKAIDNCAKAGIGVVLVPTVIGDINDHELGDIIRFGAGNMHGVRSVNFQPVSLVGRMPEKLRRRQRITIPGAIKRIEEQTDGEIGRENWFPVPCAQQITDFLEAIKQEPKYRLSIHFACGMANYVFKDTENKNKLVSLGSFFDINGFFEYLAELTQELNSAKYRSIRKTIVLSKLMLNLRKYVDNDKKPKNLKFVRMLTGALGGGGNYHGLADFHMNSMFLGMMHFQDPYNWDIDRIHKCDIHYATPDGRVLPFCTFNVIPALYRDKVQAKYSVPHAEWEAKTGKKLANDKYHRKFSSDEMKEIKAFYDQFIIKRAKPEPDWGSEETTPVASNAGIQTVEQTVQLLTGANGKGMASPKLQALKDGKPIASGNKASCGTCAPTLSATNGIIETNSGCGCGSGSCGC